MIRAVCLKHDETKQGIMSAVNSDIHFYTFRQGKDMSCDEYLKLFQAQVDTINAHGGRAGFHWGTYLEKVHVILARDRLGEHPGRELMEKAKEDADQTRYGGLKTALDNQCLLSNIGQYPNTLSEALQFLKNYKVPVR